MFCKDTFLAFTQSSNLGTEEQIMTVCHIWILVLSIYLKTVMIVEIFSAVEFKATSFHILLCFFPQTYSGWTSNLKLIEGIYPMIKKKEKKEEFKGD